MVFNFQLRGRSSVADLGHETQHGWLPIATGCRALGGRAATGFKFEQGKLRRLNRPPRLKLLAADFDNPPWPLTIRVSGLAIATSSRGLFGFGCDDRRCTQPVR
jgi:hypothetical protein